MDDQAGEDDDYSDDDLDALPDHAFHELQETAIQSTQPSLNPQVQLPTLKHSARLAGGLGLLSAPSSDYGDFDEEMLDGEIFDAAEEPTLVTRCEADTGGKEPGELTQREQWRLQHYGANLPKPGPLEEHQRVDQHGDIGVPLFNDNYSRGLNATSQGGKAVGLVNQNPTGLPTQGSADVNALQVEVQKLLREREALQQAVQNANANAYSQAGEIAIVRANATKIEKDFENRTIALQSMHADETARQKVEVEKALAELQKIATEKNFLENDLAEGTKQIRNLQKAIKKGEDKGSESKARGRGSQLVTPKKNKALAYADGFDDEEIQPMSPSRLVIRSKANTPKAGAKRKRKPTGASPVKPLELTQPTQIDLFEDTAQPQRVDDVPSANDSLSRPAPIRQDQKFKLIQKLLDHRFTPDEPRTFERLATFSFPSNRERALSTVLLDTMSTLHFEPDSDNFAAALGLMIVTLWSQCMEEKYHQPVHLLVDLVKFILVLNPIKTAPDLTNDLMSLVQSTADVILVPRCKKESPRKDRADISCIECLRVMQMMADDCSCDTEEMVRFWRTMRFDFIMMLLNFINPLDEINIMLSMLHTSILDQSFAMIIPPNNGQQDASEAHIIDNLSHLLINTPRTSPGEGPPDAAELCEVRIHVLSLIEAMCNTPHGGEALAKHRLVIGQLVRVMNDELDRVYDYHYGYEQRISLVNTATRLLYHLTSNYAHLVNMQARLSVVPGGEKKFLIALTRLAFSEGGFYEQGIEDDVVDCAHQMLEARVSPEEAEQLVEAFSSAPVSRN
ncbi:MAG: hypothetical protein ASARMPREDX12_008979 [Alectoria sarmentosa]|nr:MAG: hypothetical protein ASARMPREDX12_008979 [Alectoria sarmentosa]